MNAFVKHRPKLEGKLRAKVLRKAASSVCGDSFVSLSDVPCVLCLAVLLPSPLPPNVESALVSIMVQV